LQLKVVSKLKKSVLKRKSIDVDSDSDNNDETKEENIVTIQI